jgi:hypothetical protein
MLQIPSPTLIDFKVGESLFVTANAILFAKIAWATWRSELGRFGCSLVMLVSFLVLGGIAWFGISFFESNKPADQTPEMRVAIIESLDRLTPKPPTPALVAIQPIRPQLDTERSHLRIINFVNPNLTKTRHFEMFLEVENSGTLQADIEPDEIRFELHAFPSALEDEIALEDFQSQALETYFKNAVASGEHKSDIRNEVPAGDVFMIENQTPFVMTEERLRCLTGGSCGLYAAGILKYHDHGRPTPARYARYCMVYRGDNAFKCHKHNEAP